MGSVNFPATPRCTICGKKHKGRCLQGSTGCFMCGEEGHIKRNCPMANQARTGSQQITSTYAPQSQQEKGQSSGQQTTGGATRSKEQEVEEKVFLSMGSSLDDDEKAYADFEKKVKRTILLDNLSPEVTTQIIKAGLSQHGTVLSVQFIPNYVVPQDLPQAALVEMESQKQAETLVTQMSNCPYILFGMPRPVRARHAKATNFAVRPRRPGRKIAFRWVKSGDPDFEACRKLKYLVKRHAAESAQMLKYQLQEEEKLAKQHEEMLRSNYGKYEMIEKAIEDGSLHRLASHYNINLSDL